MREAAIVATARTAIGRAHKGAFNDTDAPALTAHVVKALIARTGLDPARIDDVILGVGTQWGTQGGNLARTAIFAAGLPESIPGTTLDRKCGSGLTALAFAARGIMTGEMDVALAGGAGATPNEDTARRNEKLTPGRPSHTKGGRVPSFLALRPPFALRRDGLPAGIVFGAGFRV